MTLEPLQYALGALSGGLVGFSLGLVGGGGSILAVPLMVYLVGVPSAHVAIGTSAPELVTTIIATIRGERAVAVGNLLGSSIYNILVILGVTCMLAPGGVPVERQLLELDIPLMTAVVIVAVPVLTGWQWVVLASPVLVALLITKVSGVPLLEQKAAARWGGQPDYEEYARTTPVLVPRLSPRRGAGAG